MNAILAAACVMFCLGAQAGQPVYRNSEVTVQLKSTLCDSAVILEAFTAVLPKTSPPVLNAIVAHHGRIIAACWTVDKATNSAIVVDEDADGGYIPMSEFKTEPDV